MSVRASPYGRAISFAERKGTESLPRVCMPCLRYAAADRPGPDALRRTAMETRMSVGTLAGTVAADDATIETRVASLDWPHIASDLDARGSAVIAGLLASHECAALAALYDEDGRFRSRVEIGRAHV